MTLSVDQASAQMKALIKDSFLLHKNARSSQAESLWSTNLALINSAQSFTALNFRIKTLINALRRAAPNEANSLAVDLAKIIEDCPIGKEILEQEQNSSNPPQNQTTSSSSSSNAPQIPSTSSSSSSTTIPVVRSSNHKDSSMRRNKVGKTPSYYLAKKTHEKAVEGEFYQEVNALFSKLDVDDARVKRLQVRIESETRNPFLGVMSFTARILNTLKEKPETQQLATIYTADFNQIYARYRAKLNEFPTQEDFLDTRRIQTTTSSSSLSQPVEQPSISGPSSSFSSVPVQSSTEEPLSSNQSGSHSAEGPVILNPVVVSTERKRVRPRRQAHSVQNNNTEASHNNEQPVSGVLNSHNNQPLQAIASQRTPEHGFSANVWLELAGGVLLTAAGVGLIVMAFTALNLLSLGTAAIITCAIGAAGSLAGIGFFANSLMKGCGNQSAVDVMQPVMPL